MRLEKTMHRDGYFWFPSTPDRKLPGKITMSDGGIIEFEVVCLSDETLHPTSFYGLQNPVRINGIVEHDGFVTLDRCRCKSCFGQFGGVSRATFDVEMVVFGRAYQDDEDVMMDSFRFSVDLMDEWIGETGISFESKRDNRLLSVFYDDVKEEIVELANGMLLKISYSWGLSGFPWISEVSVKQKIYFELISKGVIQFELFKNLSRRIATFIGFATSEAVCINYAEGWCGGVSSGGEKSSENGQVMSFFFKDICHVSDVPKYSRNEILFLFKDIGNFSVVINNWISLYDDMEDILNLYFSIRVGGQRFLEGRFLSLAQVVEAYHGRVVKSKAMDSGEYEVLTCRDSSDHSILEGGPPVQVVSDRCRKGAGGHLPQA